MIKQILSLSLVLFSFLANAGPEWPRAVDGNNGAKILIYQPQNESLKGDLLKGRAAVSVKRMAGDDPIFGAFWFEAKLRTDRDARTSTLESVKITDVRLPGVTDTTKISSFKKLLETEAINWKLELSLDDLIATLEDQNGGPQDDLKHDLKTIVYATEPTSLILMDGEPKLQMDDQLKMQRVINTAFLILQAAEDKKYYLWDGNYWYVSSSIKEGWANTTQLPKSIQPVDKSIKEQAKKEATKDAKEEAPTPTTIMVKTEPTELIQSKGAADFASISGTNLLYMKNSDDDIFMDITQQKYFVLISGRWYSSANLKGPWDFIAPDKLPADFQKIPEGSPKDNVLSSVAGTDAAHEAVIDSQIPQTAKVDRATATCTVKYDGEPKFEKIEGTSLLLAVNTSSTVMQSGNKYFCVENGVWFESAAASGPWKVSDARPADVDKIPASSTAYNTKYVYIYDTTPQYVYVGYTPGYMGCYAYGGVVVYGTGYYYNPWYGPYYYPRPVTYGFSMHYNPYTGWGVGFHVSVGYSHMYVHGGYWGPPGYHPPYHPVHHGGYYGNNNNVRINTGDININNGNRNNIYNNKKGVSTNDVKRGQGNANLNRPTTNDRQNQNRGGQNSNQNRPTTNQNNVMADRQGNVYQKNNSGWQERNNNSWQNTKQPNTNQMDRSMQQRDRGQTRSNNFSQSSMGGGARGGGGGGRRR